MSENQSLVSPVSNADMRPIKFEGVIIYHDPETNGHWLPCGVLKSLAEHQLEQALPPLLDINETTMHHSGRFCPEDGLELVAYQFAESNITVEQCLSCKGVWLDTGELKKLMEYVYDNTEEMSRDDDFEEPHLTPRRRVMLFLYQLVRRPPLY